MAKQGRAVATMRRDQTYLLRWPFICTEAKEELSGIE